MTDISRRAPRVAARATLALCASSLLAATAFLAGPAIAQGKSQGRWLGNWDRSTIQRYDACVAKTKTAPEEAYEDGLIFRNDGGGALARHCIALALLALGDTEEAASRLEEVAFMPDGGDARMRAELLSQAGNAWLLARAPTEAEEAFTQAMTVAPDDADLFIDRARARALQSRFDSAAEDLSKALSLRPRDALALRLRADAYLEQGQLDRADRDVTAALAVAPHDVDTLVVRGRIKEAKRVGIDAVRELSSGEPAATRAAAAPGGRP